MELRPAIASYTGQAFEAIKNTLDSRALGIVAQIAATPVARSQLDPIIVAELIEMHVLNDQDGLIRLSTTVFLEEDIKTINDATLAFSSELAELVIKAAPEMQCEPPAVTNFLVGIIAIGQTLHASLKRKKLVVDWKNYQGKYASSKVDLNEDCAALDVLGNDLQTKSVFKGIRYTAVFIGPGGQSYLLETNRPGKTEYAANYRMQLNLFLTDAFPMLITGQLENAALRIAAEQAGLYRSGEPKTAVLTNADVIKFLPMIHSVSHTVDTCFSGKLDYFRSLLASTTSGKQGVLPEIMMMNLWRFIRRAIAGQLYKSGFFTDDIPETGLLTVFYENDIALLAELLG